MAYVHALWQRARDGAQYTTYHEVKRNRLTPEDHDFAFNQLAAAFPNAWDTGWSLMSLAVYPTKP